MTAGEFAGMGYAPGVVRGVRSFDVDKLGRLTGVVHKQVWTPEENNAECRRSDDTWASIAQAVQASYARTFTFHYSSDPTYAGAFSGRRSATPKAVPPTSVPPVEKPHLFEECACGFYGYYDGSDDYHDDGKVTAVVEGYGETLIGTRGFRAMKARIVGLKVADKEVSYPLEQKIRRNYAGVPFFTTFDDLVAAYPPDHGLAPSPESDENFWTRSL